jgi:large subunit ribosomal protein L6
LNPRRISFDVDTKTRQVFIRGKDKEQIGQVGADIRKYVSEPYKGKGIRYQGEKIRRKAGKSGKGAKK